VYLTFSNIQESTDSRQQQQPKVRMKPLPLMSLMAQQDHNGRRRSPAYGGGGQSGLRNSPKKGYDDGARWVIGRCCGSRSEYDSYGSGSKSWLTLKFELI
jgi:hypothetical protein